MSDNNRDGENNGGGQRSARERMQQERRRQEARSRRNRLAVVIGGAVAVLVVAGAVGALVSNNTGGGSGSHGAAATPSGATGHNHLVLPAGRAEARSTLTVYEDFRCPACGQFEKMFHTTIDRLLDQGRLRVDYHIVSFIDNNLGGSGSKTAANAAACAQHEGAFTQYHDVLYANQPEETRDDFSDTGRLIRLAQQVPRLRRNAAFNRCVKRGTYDGWVAKSQDAFNKSGFNTTPTVLFNGTNVYGDQHNPFTPAELVRKVDQADRRG